MAEKAKLVPLKPVGESLHKPDTEGRASKARQIVRVAGGWQLVSYTIKDGQIEDIERSNPDVKAVILNEFKIQTAKDWSRIEG